MNVQSGTFSPVVERKTLCAMVVMRIYNVNNFREIHYTWLQVFTPCATHYVRCGVAAGCAGFSPSSTSAMLSVRSALAKLGEE